MTQVSPERTTQPSNGMISMMTPRPFKYNESNKSRRNESQMSDNAPFRLSQSGFAAGGTRKNQFNNSNSIYNDSSKQQVPISKKPSNTSFLLISAHTRKLNTALNKNE